MGEALKRRKMPSTPLTMEVEDGDGSKFTVNWQLAINYNVLADAQEKCAYNFMGGPFDWVDDSNRIRALLWASLLPYQPDLRDELLTVGEYLDGTNRLPVIEALFGAFSRYLHPSKRKGFDEGAGVLLNFMKTGEVPKGSSADPLADAGTEKSASPSPGQNSEPSPATTSDSQTTSSAA